MHTSPQEIAMYRTSTTLLIVEDTYRRERAERAFREQRRREERRLRRPGTTSRPGRHGWRRVLHLRPALPH